MAEEVDAKRIGLESALSDLLCCPDIRGVIHPDDLKDATNALAESLNCSAKELDAENERIAAKRRANEPKAVSAYRSRFSAN